jgi:Domain of unknown function (DUF1707)
MTESNERTHVSAPDDNRYDLRRGPRDRTLRVGDKERDAVSDILRQRHVEGRLDADEFHARLDRCLAAKTYAELDELIADLPGEEAGRGRVGQSWTLRPWPFPVLLLPVALIAAIASGAHLAWLALPLLFFFVVRPLLWRTSGGYGHAFWACGPRRTTRV